MQFKKVLSLLGFAALLISSSQALAATANESLSKEDFKTFMKEEKIGHFFSDKELEREDIKEFLTLSKNAKDKRIDLYNKIKNDKDFLILNDFGNGIFSYTHSEKVKTPEDFERYQRKAEKFRALEVNTYTLTDTSEKSVSGGSFWQWFDDDVVHNSVTFGDDEVEIDGKSWMAL